ncbi:MAG: hypothetical protein RI955_1606, partial [Bacteroidota bacterium]
MKLSTDLQHFLNESKNCVCVCINKSDVATDWEVVFLNSAIINKFSMVKEIKLPTNLLSLAPEIIGINEIELGEKAFFNHEKITYRKNISSTSFGELIIDFTFFKIDNFLVFEIDNITNNVITENDLSLTTSILNEVYEIAEMYPFEIYLSTGVIKTTFNIHDFFDEQDKSRIYTIADLH